LNIKISPRITNIRMFLSTTVHVFPIDLGRFLWWWRWRYERKRLMFLNDLTQTVKAPNLNCCHRRSLITIIFVSGKTIYYRLIREYIFFLYKQITNFVSRIVQFFKTDTIDIRRVILFEVGRLNCSRKKMKNIVT